MMYKNAVKKLSFVIMYVPDQYKIPEMYDKVNLENGGVLRFISDCYKNVLYKEKQTMRYKAMAIILMH